MQCHGLITKLSPAAGTGREMSSYCVCPCWLWHACSWRRRAWPGSASFSISINARHSHHLAASLSAMKLIIMHVSMYLNSILCKCIRMAEGRHYFLLACVFVIISGMTDRPLRLANVSISAYRRGNQPIAAKANCGHRR